MKCYACFKDLDEGEKICPHCGTGQDELHDYLRRINPGFSSIAIPERIYLEELQNVTKFFEGIAKSTEEYFKIEKAKLQKQNVTREEISEIMRTDSKFIEGHEIITIMLPIKELIDISK